MSFIDRSKEQTRSPFRMVDLGLDNPLSLIDVTPIAWWDAKDASTVILNGSNVEEWRDKSGNDHHLEQDTTNKQPAYANGIITFDGVDDQLLRDNVIPDGNITIFALYKRLSASSTGYVISNQGSGGSKSRTYIKPSNIDLGNTELSHNLDVQNENTLVTIWANDGDGATQHVRVNSGTHFESSVDRGATNDDISIGAFRSGSSYFNGEIKEIIIFDYQMSYNHRTMMEIKLMDKWGM